MDQILLQADDRDRAAVLDTVHLLARAVDLRQWDALRSVVAAEVEVEEGEPDGGAAERLTADEFVARRRRAYNSLDGTQHRIEAATVTVQGARAQVESRTRASYVRHGAPGGDTRELAATCHHELVRTGSGWKVARVRVRLEGVPALGRAWR